MRAMIHLHILSRELLMLPSSYAGSAPVLVLAPFRVPIPDISTLCDSLAAPLPALTAGEMLHGLAVRNLL